MSDQTCRLAQIPFDKGYFENKKGPGTKFQTTFSVEYFNKISLLDKAQFNLTK